MAEIVIIVKGGMVQEAYSTEKDTVITVYDLDTGDEQQVEAETELPEHRVL